MRKTLLRTNITVLHLCLHFVYIECRRRRPIDCILSFLSPAETDDLVPVFSQSTDVVVVNFVVVLKLPIIVEPLTEIINLSLVSECFPDTLKIAKDLSIFKTGDPEKLENYRRNRPISILPAFSKLYEKVVYNRIYKYLTNHNLL